MLRKLFLKKNSLVFKKNLSSNYIIYNSFLFDFLKKKNNHLNEHYLFEKVTYDIYNPLFFFNKRLLNSENFFRQELKNNNLNYIFINKNYQKFKYFKNTNIVLLNNDSNIKNFILKNKAEDIYFPLDVKYTNKNITQTDSVNFFILCNFSLLLDVEIYKIIIICYINSLKK